MDLGLRTGTTGGFGRPTATALLVAAGVLLVPPAADANPALIYEDAGSGGALLPRNTDDVRIVSERLEFVERPEEHDRPTGVESAPWHVRAEYVLENLTAEPVEADVGFPVAGDRGDWNQQDGDDEGGGPVYEWVGERGTAPFAASFHVRLDGRALPHRLETNECPAGPDGGTGAGFCYSHLFVFRLAIAARAQAALTVEYDQDVSLCCNEEGGGIETYAWADYILETGALWAGTIGRLDIVYVFAAPPPDGVLVDDKLVGPRMPGGPWGEGDLPHGGSSGWSRLLRRPRKPEGVMDLWDPAVRFHYAFACQNDRIVLRLKATDFEPRGNISLGVQIIPYRLSSLRNGEHSYDGPSRDPCAVSRDRSRDSPDSWSSWTRRSWSAERDREVTEVVEPPPEWNCSSVDWRTEYRYDCCCAAAAERGGWNPDCDKPGGSRKGCAAAGGMASADPPVPAADGGVADAGEGAAAPDGAVAELEPYDVPSGVLDAAAAAVAAAVPDAVVEGSGAEGGSGARPAALDSPSAPTGGDQDGSTAPAGAAPKRGCGCRAAGAGGSGAWGLATLAGLLLVRWRRQNVGR